MDTPQNGPLPVSRHARRYRSRHLNGPVRTVWPAVTILPAAARETTHRADLAARVRELRDKPYGLGTHRIAKRLGVSFRTVIGIVRAGA